MPNFRVIVLRTQIVNGTLHRHVHLLSKRGEDWCVVGVMILHPAEWDRFCLICEITEIEVKDAPLPIDAIKAPTPK